MVDLLTFLEDPSEYWPESRQTGGTATERLGKRQETVMGRRSEVRDGGETRVVRKEPSTFCPLSQGYSFLGTLECDMTFATN